MRLNAVTRILVLGLCLAAIPLTADGQARVVIQVLRSFGGGTIPFAGAFVCFSASNNTKVANSSGQVVFDNIPAGSSGSAIAWSSGFKQKRVDITVPAGATVIPAVVQLNERSSEAPFCIVPRLGEEKFPMRGEAPLTTPDENTLDCHRFSQSHVMVGIYGKHGQGVDEIILLCRKLQSGGTLGPPMFTDKWDQHDNAGTAFNRTCPEGQVVSAMQVTVHPESREIRSITIHCKTIGANGLTSGSALILASIGTPSTTVLNLDTCNGGRPARAIRAGADLFHPMFPKLFAPFVVATTQFICEQPLVL